MTGSGPRSSPKTRVLASRPWRRYVQREIEMGGDPVEICFKDKNQRLTASLPAAFCKRVARGPRGQEAVGRAGRASLLFNRATLL